MERNAVQHSERNGQRNAILIWHCTGIARIVKTANKYGFVKLVRNDGFVKINETLKAEKQRILQNNENINSAIANNISSILLLVLSASTVLFGIGKVSHHVFFQKKVEPGQHGTTE
jgi:ABC-type bacteriocin/lantibiotic exporter with double-glycine peptidase domain